MAAFTSGRAAVSRFDCLLLQHVLWQRPDEAPRIADWLIARLAVGDSLKSLDYSVAGAGPALGAAVVQTCHPGGVPCHGQAWCQAFGGQAPSGASDAECGRCLPCTPQVPFVLSCATLGRPRVCVAPCGCCTELLNAPERGLLCSMHGRDRRRAGPTGMRCAAQACSRER